MTAIVHLLVLAVLPVLLGRGAGAGGEVVALSGPAAEAPVFAPRQRTTVRGVQGHSVTLKCRVLQLGDKSVSWVRVRDLQILTHSGVVFTADRRVSVPAPAPADGGRPAAHTHALRVDRLNASDAGRYDCQVNTEPKMSLFFDLSIVDESETEPPTEAVTYPWEEDEVEVWPVDSDQVQAPLGGTAELACKARVRNEPVGAAPPLDIRWLRDGKPITLLEGWAVSRLAGAAHAESRLQAAGVRARDAGPYTCAVGAHAATVHLSVSEEENLVEMEAMQRDQSAGDAGHLAQISLASALALLLLMQLVAF